MTQHRPPWRHSDDDRPSDQAPGRELVLRPTTTPARRSTGARATASSVRTAVVTAVTAVGRIVTNEHATSGARWLVRNAIIYVLTGTWVLTRRLWEARTNARYERLMRSAEAAGDFERLTDWEQRAEHARERRHRRRMDWVTAPLDLARTVAVVGLCGIGLLLGLGGVLAIAHRDTAWLLAPAQRAVDSIAWLVWLLDGIWLPLTVAAPGLLLAGLWQVGRRHGQCAPLGRPIWCPGLSRR